MYWEAREQEQLYDTLLLNYERALAAEYRRCLGEVKTQLSDLYDEILEASADGTLLPSDLYKFNRYYDLINYLSSQLTRMGYREQKITESYLQSMYQKNCQLLSQKLNFSTYFDETQMRSTINAIWCADGKHWSTRIWDNKKKLQSAIEKGITDCIARGTPKRALINELTSNFASGFSNADRLARTELTYVQNQSTKDKFIEAGVKRYKFLAAHDDRTSEICKALDGKEFNLRDAKVGINFPPCHPNCRSTILAIIE